MSTWRRSLATLFLLFLPACHRAAPPPAGPDGCGVARWRVPAAVNAVRQERGLRGLKVDVRLVAAAERHSTDMARHRFVDHTGGDGTTVAERAREAGYRAATVGEVLAGAYPSAGAVVADWLLSRPHRRVLLLPAVSDIGAACTVGPDGAAYWTAVIGAKGP